MTLRVVPPAVFKMTEEQLLESVLQLAGMFGWKRLHIRPARTATSWRTPVQGVRNLACGWPHRPEPETPQ